MFVSLPYAYSSLTISMVSTKIPMVNSLQSLITMETEREQRIIRSASSFLEIYGYDLKRHTEIVDSIEHLEFVTKTCGVRL